MAKASLVSSVLLITRLAVSLSKWWKARQKSRQTLLPLVSRPAREIADWSPGVVALMALKGGQLASTGCGMKERFWEWAAWSIQASMFGWMSERRKGIGRRFLVVRAEFMSFSIMGTGPGRRR